MQHAMLHLSKILHILSEITMYLYIYTKSNLVYPLIKGTQQVASYGTQSISSYLEIFEVQILSNTPPLLHCQP